MFREHRIIGVRASDFLVPSYGMKPKKAAVPMQTVTPVARPRTAVRPTRVVVPDASGVGSQTMTGSGFSANQQDVRRQEALRPLVEQGKAAGIGEQKLREVNAEYGEFTTPPPPGTPVAPAKVPGQDPSTARQTAVRRTAEEKAGVLFDLSRKTDADKFSAIGIDQNRAKLYDWMKSTGYKVEGTMDGKLTVAGATPEVLKQLQEMGAVDATAPVGQNFNVLLRLSEEDYRSQYPQYDFIKGGGDVKQAIKDYQNYERQSTADLASTSRDVGEPKFQPQGQQQQPQGQADGRSAAVMDLVKQGVTDPNEISQYMNGDVTPEEAQQIMQSQRPQTTLPPYSADPLSFIDSYGDNFKSLQNAGYQREDAQEFLRQDEEDSRYMYSQGLEDATTRREQQIEFSADMDDLERNREISTHEKELAITQIDNARAEVVARDQAEEDEEVSRRVAARLGITQGGAGVKWLRDIVRKSSEHLSYMIQRGGLEAAGMVRQHANNMADIDHNALVRYDKAWEDYTTEKGSLTKQRLLDKKTARSERARIDKEYNDKLFEVDKWKGENYLKELQRSDDRAFETYKLDRQEKIEGAKTRVQTSKDRISFARDTANIIAQRPSYKEFDEIQTRTKVSEETYSLYERKLISRSVMANVLTKNFEKILDPTSVVREGEFKMTEELQGWFSPETWMATIQKLSDGGTAVPDEIFKDMILFAQAATRMHQKRAQNDASPLLWQVQEYNEMIPDNPIRTEMAVPMGLDSTDWNPLEDIAAQYHAEGGDAPSFDYTKEDTAPPVNSHVQTTVVAGVITNYGSAVSLNGLDISAQAGTPVRAPMGGTIEEVTFDPSWRGSPFSDGSDYRNQKKSKSEKYTAQKGQNGGWGNSVVAKLDNGFKIRVSHLSYTVAQEMKGKRIEYGTELGKIGNTGLTYGPTGNHVDIEMFDDKGKRLNPRQIAAFIGAGGGEPNRDPANDYIPQAHASDYVPEDEPEETPNVPQAEEPAEQPTQEVNRSGQTLTIGTPMVKNAALVEKPAGAFRNVKTGELSYPTKRQLVFYQQSPHIYEDLTKPRDTTTPKPAPKIAGGKTINLLPKKK